MTATFAGADKAKSSPPSDHVPDLSYHLAALDSAPPASGRLVIRVGGVAVSLEGVSPDRQAALESRYGIFCRDQAGPADLAVRILTADTDRFLAVREPGETYRVDLRWAGDTLLASSYEWAGWLRPRTQASVATDGLPGGCLTLARDAMTDPRAFQRSVENFLRVAFGHLILSRGGFLLHSAGLVLGGSAHLFFGPSGSGKTTVASLTPEALILSDDLTLVVRGEGGEPRACSVPFRGLHAPEPVSAGTYPIRGFFRLVQDSSDRLVPLAGARAIGELVGSLPFVMERPEMAGDAMDGVAQAVRQAPVFRLHFRKDRTFWNLIDARPGAVDGFSKLGGN